MTSNELAAKARDYNSTLAYELIGIGHLLPLVRRLLHFSHISDALILLDAWHGPHRYSFADVRKAVVQSLEKVGIQNDGRRVDQRLVISDEDEYEKISAPRKMDYEQILQHLDARGIDTALIPEDMLLLVVKMCRNYGTSIMEPVIERIAERQTAHPLLRFSDLAHE